MADCYNGIGYSYGANNSFGGIGGPTAYTGGKKRKKKKEK